MLGAEPFPAIFIRAPWVEAAGPAVDVLATVVRGSPPTQDSATEAGGTIVAVRQGSLLATSFHPELTGDTRMHALFVRMVRES